MFSANGLWQGRGFTEKLTAIEIFLKNIRVYYWMERRHLDGIERESAKISNLKTNRHWFEPIYTANAMFASRMLAFLYAKRRVVKN